MRSPAATLPTMERTVALVERVAQWTPEVARMFAGGAWGAREEANRTKAGSGLEVVRVLLQLSWHCFASVFRASEISESSDDQPPLPGSLQLSDVFPAVRVCRGASFCLCLRKSGFIARTLAFLSRIGIRAPSHIASPPRLELHVKRAQRSACSTASQRLRPSIFLIVVGGLVSKALRRGWRTVSTSSAEAHARRSFGWAVARRRRTFRRARSAFDEVALGRRPCVGSAL